VELAKVHAGDALVSRMVNRVVLRADEITELLAFYAMSNDRKERKQLHRLSKQVQRGLSQAFNRFDEYQFAKYNRDTVVTLRDALFLVHPKAKDATQQVIFDKIAQQELQVPYTWETTMSAIGKVTYNDADEKAAAFRTAWEQLVATNALGYMAMLRNLRNLLEYNVSAETINKVIARLSDRDAVLKAKQLPFRFLAAYRELRNVKHGLVGEVMQALEKAVQVSVEHVKGFGADTRVVIACDVSGSMQMPISKKSAVKYYDIGLMLGMLLQHKCTHVLTGMFGDKWKAVGMEKDNILANVDAFYEREGEVGYATNGYKVLESLVRYRNVVDKVMFFTDCQMWDSYTKNSNNQHTLYAQWKLYKEIAPDAKLYLFDLAGHGNVPVDVMEDDVYLIAGWSDKVFDVLAAIENGVDAVEYVKMIEM
jgi:hypothetical protein